MFYSKLYAPTLREAPSDADIISAKLMIRSGMIRKVASGLYEFLPLGLRALRKVENIIRREMNAAGGQEVVLPLIFPKELWIETGRWNVYGKELFRLKDRKDAEFCLAPTAEEGITDLVRKDVKSYKQLPVMFYQFGTKFRDEIRPRFGIMRAREFLMKDAYSFHADDADLEKYYKTMFDAYTNICSRCGFKFRAVEAASGAIGGSFSHEFMVLAEAGEEEIAHCECGYGANTEKAECLEIKYPKETENAAAEVYTPSIGSVEEVSKFLKISAEKFIKTLIYVSDGQPAAVLVRGDFEVNEIKLQSLLGSIELSLADDKTIEEATGAPCGFAGPVNLKKKIKVIADLSVINLQNAVVGANKKDYHLKDVNVNRDFKYDIAADVRKIIKGDACPKCKTGKIDFARGIEIGHCFKLGTKYSKSMNATYLDTNGKENLMVMGCYGIGVTRILAATIEQSHDDNGIIWPDNIAPFEVIIVPVNFADAKTKEATEKIYKELSSKGIDVLIDDRDERAGIKFKDADLIGIPYRITIGEKNLANGNVEFKARKNSKEAVELLKPQEAVNKIISIYKR
ncbi:proline--tRNA ligase [Endomicrobium proavitum]|uniref:Proline--tRNA ligase n=1 Tax=Endomicrobium proavitum TaxID=1408281 RepID=A0A0G3WH47_9BACT|nr:proline--tRNA ligase [Endomicrobium proavitum]AKL97658.1 prolyl-tRNA synthetase [Endomicrobium proavitum]